MPLLKINFIKLLEQEHLTLSTVSAVLIASAKIPFNKNRKLKCHTLENVESPA